MAPKVKKDELKRSGVEWVLQHFTLKEAGTFGKLLSQMWQELCMIGYGTGKIILKFPPIEWLWVISKAEKFKVMLHLTATKIIFTFEFANLKT